MQILYEGAQIPSYPRSHAVRGNVSLDEYAFPRQAWERG